MTPRFLLDTNVWSELMRAAPDRALARKVAAATGSLTTGAPAWHELRFGVARLPASPRKTRLGAYLDELGELVPILPYDDAAASWHADERARLESGGKTPPYVDGQLAAIAAIRGLVLVTRNVRDFAAFTGLTVERW